jgi:hypothetical protein
MFAAGWASAADTGLSRDKNAKSPNPATAPIAVAFCRNRLREAPSNMAPPSTREKSPESRNPSSRQHYTTPQQDASGESSESGSQNAIHRLTTQFESGAP